MADRRRRGDAAQREADAREAERPRAVAVEPRDDRDGDGLEATETRTDRHHDVEQEELPQRMDRGKQQEPDRERFVAALKDVLAE